MYDPDAVRQILMGPQQGEAREPPKLIFARHYPLPGLVVIHRSVAMTVAIIITCANWQKHSDCLSSST